MKRKRLGISLREFEKHSDCSPGTVQRHLHASLGTLPLWGFVLRDGTLPDDPRLISAFADHVAANRRDNSSWLLQEGVRAPARIKVHAHAR